MAVIAGRGANRQTGHHGPARARAAEAVVGCLRRHVGRGPDRARAAFLGEQTIAVELGRVLTAADRTLTGAGRADVVEGYWRQLGNALAPELQTEMARALGVEAACTSWVIDAGADTMLLVFALREPPPS